MTAAKKAAELLAHPAALGRALGFKDFQDSLHGEWIKKIVTGEKDMTLQAHRGSYKTTCLCVAISMLMIFERKKNIIFMRKTDNDVVEVVKSITRILNSEIFQTIYKALTHETLAITKSTGTELTTSAYQAPRGAAQLLGMGINGSMTGKHADIIITDDIINLRDRLSRAEREKTKAVYMELQNIRNPGGRIINTGTPWHKEDAFSLMPEPMKYDCYHTGILTEEKLAELRASMSPSLFAANYELLHIASEDALFQTAPVFITEAMAKEVLKRDAKPAELLRDGIAHIDAAYGGEDYTAFTCGKRIGGKLYLYGKMWHGHVDTALDFILSETQRLMCGPVMCENNADKNFLAREIMSRGYKARPYAEKENKYHKISEYLRKWWPNIVWLEGTDREYLSQILDYTEDAEHDDAPDSAAVVARFYDRRSGEEYKSPFGG